MQPPVPDADTRAPVRDRRPPGLVTANVLLVIVIAVLVVRSLSVSHDVYGQRAREATEK